MSIADYTFNGLRDCGRPGAIGSPSLCYLVSLIDSANHKISDTLCAKPILGWLYDVEEQAPNSNYLKKREEFFGRYFSGGFFPKTPCMVVDEWSPVSAMLEHGLEPVILNREPNRRAVATGIWSPVALTTEHDIATAGSDEELFWAILEKAMRLALDRNAWISVIAQPGWLRSAAIKSLPAWSGEDILSSGRILWKRTSEG